MSLQSDLVEAQNMLDAKCTIAGCWKTKYAEAQKKLKEIREEATRYLNMPSTGECCGATQAVARDILSILGPEMDAETAKVYIEGLVAMHDERHPEGD